MTEREQITLNPDSDRQLLLPGLPVSKEGDRYGTNPLYGGCQAYPPFSGLL